MELLDYNRIIIVSIWHIMLITLHLRIRMLITDTLLADFENNS